MAHQLRVSAIAVLVALGWQSGLVHAQDAKPTTEQILRAWKARQDKAVTAHFEMSVESTIPKGSSTLRVQAAGFAPKAAAGGEVEPPQDTIVKGTSSLSLSGSKMRYSYDVPQWDRGHNELHEVHYADTFDGRLFKSLRNPSEPNKANYPAGHVEKAEGTHSVTQLAIIPLIWALRGDHKQFFHNLAQFDVTGRKVAISDQSCLELVRRTQPGGNKREVMYVDPMRDYVVARMAIMVEDKPTMQVDVAYSPDKAVGWIPHSWEYTIRLSSNNSLLEAQRRTVTSYEIGGPIDDSEFDLQFPPGTRVMDRSEGGNVQYVIREDSSKGRVIPSALTPTYEELKKSDRKPNRLRLFIIWGGVLALILVCWILIRRRSRRVARGAGPSNGP